MQKYLQLILMFTFFSVILNAQENKKFDSSLLKGLKARGIGPSITGGRISDFAVNPERPSTYLVAVASGNIWKTTNSGITFKPVFDSYGSYSVGCISIDPNNPFVYWAGSGENNSQRSVAWGDGVYKSTDEGETWTNMGLKKSEHIGKIVIDPRNSDVVYVTAQGPLWGPGGDRGIYKTTDGGDTWEQILKISENTGVSDLVIDPRNSDVIYASSYQRRRHTWTLINGGPESAIYKSVDAGKNWNKINKGLPNVDLGRIGLAIAPSNPDVLYAIIEAADDKGGVFRSTNRGASWEKRNDHVSASPQYYQELVCDPNNENVLYSLSTYTMVSDDGAKTFKRLGLSERHVDDHALWINPNDSQHLLLGGDGGIYETYDRGDSWRFFDNLPITQFYRIQADNDSPFYNVYGGTQDNNSLGGPAQTTSEGGIYNQDWIFLVGGDGYEPQIDPTNPDIIYAQWQYGNLVRFDKKSGEITGIKPTEEEDEELRWNWDTPVIISPHSPTRLYIAANKVFRSDDRGNSWVKISDDLTRLIDRNQLKVMDIIQSPEAVAKNKSTSLYGNIVSLAESEAKEGVIWVGTDDGLVQVTSDGGKNWTKFETISDAPKLAYVADIYPSRHDANTAYVLLNNHKNNDFKPYIYKTIDLGKSWTKINNNLPENEPLWTIEEDTESKNLLFVGTEFSLFYSIDGGSIWHKFTNGLPTIAVRDLDIQERESDLVIGTFGRGIYILDNYTILRELSENLDIINNDAHIFTIKDALIFTKQSTTGRRNMGANYYRAENPTYGATFDYYLKDTDKTKKDKRKEAEKQAFEKGTDIKYPSLSELRAEDLEESPYLLFIIKDANGSIIRKLKSNLQKGLNRLNWDLTYSSDAPLNSKTNPNKHSGVPVVPGMYSVEIHKSIDGIFTKLTDPFKFNVKLLDNRTLPADNIAELDDFRKDVQKMYGAVIAVSEILSKNIDKMKIIKNTLIASENSSIELLEKSRKIELKLAEINKALNGDQSISSRDENQTPSVSDRIGYIIYTIWETNSKPTETNKKSYAIASKQLKNIINELKTISDVEIAEISNQLENINAPWTPDRFPKW